MTITVTEGQLRRAIGYDCTAAHHIEQAYLWMRERKVSMPPVFHIDIDPQSAIDVKGAYVEGLPAFAIKMASGFYNNSKHGLASSSSAILLISAETGFCEAVFLDNGYLMNLRTALAGAVAADHLARKDTGSMGIVGTGVQAREQLAALEVIRDIREVHVWGRDVTRTEACAEDMRARTRAKVHSSAKLEDLVRRSDIITTTTQSVDPRRMDPTRHAHYGYGVGFARKAGTGICGAFSGGFGGLRQYCSMSGRWRIAARFSKHAQKSRCRDILSYRRRSRPPFRQRYNCLRSDGSWCS